jgi:hypothetical protein
VVLGFLKTLFIYLFIFKFSKFIYSHVHTLFGPFLSPDPCPLPPTPCFQAEPVLPFSPILLRRIRNNKRDKVFLLVKIRIAIQRDS